MSVTTEQLSSPRAWARLLGERGPQLLVVVLLLAIALDAALILSRLLGGGALPPAPAVGALPFGTHARNPQLMLANIVDGHLFGSATVSGGTDAPPTTLQLVLTGVIADHAHPGRGAAIIGATEANAKLYPVGSALAGGARLHAVYSDRVLLERNGHLETLMLPRTPLPGMNYPPPGGQTGTAALRATNPAVLAGLVRVQPVFSQGKLAGYRIFPGPSGAHAFTQLGLRPGDLIVAINGTSLDDPTQALQVLQTLSTSGSATVTVSRNGAPQEVNLNLAEVTQEEQSAQGSGGAQGAPTPVPLRRRPFMMRE